MAIDPRKRQKKLERKRSKVKAQQKALASRDPRDLAVRIEKAVDAPILHCCTTDDLNNHGIASVLVSRELKSGNVAFVVFLVDMYCLGVKDVIFQITPRSRYDQLLREKLFPAERHLSALEPAAARKLVEGAVAYARQWGLPPHRDYTRAARIFGNIDASSCDREFVYGKNGKPCFIAGPHDSISRCHQIVGMLNDCCGTDGFTYFLPVSASIAASLLDEGPQEVELEDDEPISQPASHTHDRLPPPIGRRMITETDLS